MQNQNKNDFLKNQLEQETENLETEILLSLVSGNGYNIKSEQAEHIERKSDQASTMGRKSRQARYMDDEGVDNISFIGANKLNDEKRIEKRYSKKDRLEDLIVSNRLRTDENKSMLVRKLDNIFLNKLELKEEINVCIVVDNEDIKRSVLNYTENVCFFQSTNRLLSNEEIFTYYDVFLLYNKEQLETKNQGRNQLEIIGNNNQSKKQFIQDDKRNDEEIFLNKANDCLMLFVDTKEIINFFSDKYQSLREGKVNYLNNLKQMPNNADIVRHLKLQLDLTDKEKVKNDKIIARLYCYYDNITAICGDDKNILFSYCNNQLNKNYGTWKRLNNEDEIASGINKMINGLELNFLLSAGRIKKIIQEIYVFDKDKFFIFDNERKLIETTFNKKICAFKDYVLTQDLKFEKYSPNLFVTSKLPHSFTEEDLKGNKETFIINNFLDQIFSDRNEEGKAQIIRFIMYKIGQALFGESANTQDCLLFIGRGGGGKGTLANLIRYLFIGDGENMMTDNVSSLSIDQINSQRNSFFLSSLFNKYINIVGEVSEETRLDSEMMKQILGGDMITAEYKNKPMFSFINKALFIIMSNHLPYIRDNNEASWRRFKVIKFNKTFIGNPDANLLDKMKKEAVPFMAKCLLVYIEAKNDKEYPVPHECSSILQDILSLNDKITQYFNDSIEIIPKEKCLGMKPPSQPRLILYQDFVAWCKECGVKPYSAVMFMDKLRSCDLYTSGKIGIEEYQRATDKTIMINITYIKFRNIKELGSSSWMDGGQREKYTGDYADSYIFSNKK